MVKLKIDQFIETYGYKGTSDLLRTLVDTWCKDYLSEAQKGLVREVAGNLEEALEERVQTVL